MADTPRPHLKLWVYPATGYAGADLSDWYPIVGKHRDSDAMARVNFDTALARLQAIPGHDEIKARLRTYWAGYDVDGEDRPAVMSASFSNPLVGWSETIFVHKDAAPAVLDEAESILADLEAYPSLDDDALSELEWEEVHDYWRDMGLRGRAEICRAEGVSIFAARRADEIPDPDGSGAIYDRLRGC